MNKQKSSDRKKVKELKKSLRGPKYPLRDVLKDIGMDPKDTKKPRRRDSKK